MKRAAANAPKVEVRSRKDLRRWLDANHATAPSIWLVTYKKHTDHYPSYDDIIAELLCWGWIDSQTRKIDTDRSAVLIARRNPKSAWSAVNKRKVDEERAAGRMMPAGEALIAVAQDTGMWTFLDDVEALIVPDDLADAILALRSDWDAYPRSVKRGALEWLKTAKTKPTRDKRIADIATSLANGLRPSPFRR